MSLCDRNNSWVVAVNNNDLYVYVGSQMGKLVWQKRMICIASC